MKKLLILLSLITPLTYAQDSIQLTCINGNINKIKTTADCQAHIEALKAIPKPNCLYGTTRSATVKIMMEAKKNSCIVESSPNVAKTGAIRQRVFNYTSNQDIGKLKQYIDIYNQEIGLKAN
jgi:hypothetical protein